MDDFRFGTVIRLVRQARGWRQDDLAKVASVSQSTVSRIERGHVGSLSTDTIRAVASAIDVRVDLIPRWRGGDLDRLMNRGHSSLHESVARMFRDGLAAWTLAPEVSFAVFGERGVIDILAWHAGRQALLVIELKTDIIDVNELLGTLDRKRRLAARIGAERGWDPVAVSAWLIVREGRTSRRRVQAHAAMLAGALPDDRKVVREWLRDPVGAVAGLSFWTDTRAGTSGHANRPIRRVRVATTGRPERGPS